MTVYWRELKIPAHPRHYRDSSDIKTWHFSPAEPVPATPGHRGPGIQLTGALCVNSYDKHIPTYYRAIQSTALSSSSGLFKCRFITKTCPCNIQRFFSICKIETFKGKHFIFLIFLHKSDYGCTLEALLTRLTMYVLE